MNNETNVANTIELNYGKKTFSLSIDDDWDVTVIAKPPMRVLDDPAESVRAALREPVGGEPLQAAARECQRACIVICDVTRPVPNGVILPEIVRTLLDAGMAKENITVLIATGLHRPNLDDELAEVVGDEWVLETVRIENHYARDDDQHIEVGVTSRGTRVLLDRRFVEADLKLVVGLVEPHLMAGYSGGRKMIAPGVAHKETITTFHSARFMEHPRATNCVLQGNPLHEDQLEIVQMIGGASAVNVVIDDKRRLALVNFGEIVESHLAAVDFVRQYAEVPIAHRFQTIVTSASGYPLDKTYYQTAKGIVGPLDILAPGGNLIVVSEGSEGLGSAEYVEAQRRFVEQGPERFLSEIQQKTHADIDEWQTEMLLRATRIGTVHLYTTGLESEHRALTGVRMTDSVEETIRASVAESGDPRVAVIPEGPYVAPTLLK